MLQIRLGAHFYRQCKQKKLDGSLTTTCTHGILKHKYTLFKLCNIHLLGSAVIKDYGNMLRNDLNVIY